MQLQKFEVTTVSDYFMRKEQLMTILENEADIASNYVS